MSWWPTKDKIRYGLDIQGGLYLVMGVDVPSVLKESTTRLALTLDSMFKEKSLNVVSVKRDDNSLNGLSIIIKMGAAGEESAVRDLIEKNYGTNLQILNVSGTEITLKYSDLYINDLKKRTIDQSIETIRNRIDEFGVSEPSIAAQGESRILIQLPGIKDAERAKELINRTARLEFRIEDTSMSKQQVAQIVADAEKTGNYTIKSMKYSEYVKKINADIKNKLPQGSIVLFGKNENALEISAGKVPYLLKEVALAGDSLKDAGVAMSQDFNEPYVSLSFNADGANKFAQVTGENVNKNMAIILDNVVYSAPNIRQKISGGNAQITLGSGRDYNAQMSEARDIAMALRAGALPAALEQLEERTVGPTLGMDSIQKGIKASYIAATLIVLFMLIYYKGAGLIADVALGINIFLILSILTALNATLTLPGIAGIALTIGMAVDANVIIFERIREELRKNSSNKAAIEIGFDKAFWAIFDANICSAITSLILMHYGTGAVKGFAVTLLTGIVTSLFASVFVTRTMIELLIDKVGFKKLSV
ncbi:MAG: protein translocase subunit SecD [Oligoflexia bacterium]|nr:protein translocase subunit SecD [Oligoflexia bacterium]